MPRPITTRQHDFKSPDERHIDFRDGRPYFTSTCVCGTEIRAETEVLMAEYKRAHFTMVAHAMRRVESELSV